MRFKYLFIISAVSLVFTSCLVDTAEIPPHQSVTVYSDCLTKADLDLFRQFRKKEHIRVKIVSLPADSILKIIQAEKFNTKADLVLLKSLYDVQRIHKAGILQSVKSWKLDELVSTKFKAKDNTWFGIGVNPYVFVAKNDTISTLSEFGQLLHKENYNKWSTNLEKPAQLIPMLAPILQKKKRSDAIEWYMDFKENDYAQTKEYDKKNVAVLTTDVLVTDYQTYAKMSSRNDSTDFQMHLIFPNQNKQGTFYNLMCAGVVKQARNYTNAKLLIEYLATVHMNEKINNRWNIFPISLQSRTHPFAYQNTIFKIFQGSSARITVNYPNLNRIIKNKKKRKVVKTVSEIVEETPENSDE